MEGLDENCLELLSCVQELHEKKQQLQILMNNGYLHMSKARYIMGANSISAMHYSPVMSAKTFVDVRNTGSENDYIKFVTETCKTENKSVPMAEQDAHRPDVRQRGSTMSQDDEKVESIGAAPIEMDPGEDNKHDTTAFKNPLHWFGVLPPQTLRYCQLEFIKATELVSFECTLAEHKSEMVVLPSSPVWYQSRGIDTSQNGVLAFASRNLIYLLDLTKERPEIYGILSGHRDKVTSCSFCHSSSQEQLLRLVSGAEDCSVKVWDAQQKLLVSEHSAHGACKIISVHWSPVNPSLVLSGDEKGFVVCWNIDNDTTDRFCPDGTSQMQLTCLTCSPHQENIVGIGYKSGAVSVMDIKMNGMVIRKLRGHTNEVHAVVWAPKQSEEHIVNDLEQAGETQNTSRQAVGVIASSSKDRTIKLWNVEKGKCVRTLKVPSRPSKGRRVNSDVARLYVALFWPADSTMRFISSGYNGDIIAWNLDPDAKDAYEILACQSHDAGHHRIVFNITSGSYPGSIVTSSMDRQILHWTIPASSGPDWLLPTLGGFVYAVSVSPKDPSLLAVGVGDGMIRIWRTGSTRSVYDITTLWQGIKEKVMALSWHPEKEGCLAYATEDGKVGIYDTLSQRPPVIAETYHLKPVYALSWGPRCFTQTTDSSVQASSTNISQLFSCGGDGVIYQHNPLKFSDDAVDIDKIISSTNILHTPGRHSEVSWCQDGRLLAIGNDNGVVNIYASPHLLHILEVKCHTKIVNCVKWRPVNDDSADAPLQIVTGSNSSVIYVHDITKTFTDNDYVVGENVDKPMLITKPTRSLVGHLARITGISYNPRNPDEVVSSSYDGTAQVWDIASERPLSNFRGHHGRLMCIAWSSVTLDATTQTMKKSGLIYSGSDDYTLHGWFAEDQQHTQPVKAMPDFGYGVKNRFPNKKKGKPKKASQDSASQRPQWTAHDFSNSGDLDELLERKKAELLTSLATQEDGGVTNGDNSSIQDSSTPRSTHNDLHSLSSVDKCPPLSTKQRGEESVGASGDWRSANTDEQFTGKKRKRVKNMFQQSVTLDNRNKLEQHKDCIRIVQWKMKEVSSSETPELSFLPGSGDCINLGLYTGRSAAFRMMKIEAEKMEEGNLTEGSSNLKIWMGDIVGAVEDAIEKSQLTDHLVSLSPMAGHMFWQKTCRAFAKQLSAEDHKIHAVHYLIACGDVHEAVQLLLDGRHYREAVALAKARLSNDDPVLEQTIKVWAVKLRNGGSVELAAKCFASIGKFSEAAACLAQRASSGVSTVTDSDVSSLWSAVCVAQHACEYDLAMGYASRALRSVCLRTWRWSDTNMVFEAFDILRPYSLLMVIHEILATTLVAEGAMDSPATCSKSHWNNDEFYLKGQGNCRASLPKLLVRIWKTLPPSADLDSERQVEFDIESCRQICMMSLGCATEHMTPLKAVYQVALTVCAMNLLSPALRQQYSSSNSTPRVGTVEIGQAQDWTVHFVNSVKSLRANDTPGFGQATEILLNILAQFARWANGGLEYFSEERSGLSGGSEQHVVSLKSLSLIKITQEPCSGVVNGTNSTSKKSDDEEIPAAAFPVVHGATN